jgi:hypothetical protein
VTPIRNRAARPRSSGGTAAALLALAAFIAALALSAAGPALAVERADATPPPALPGASAGSASSTTATFGVQPATGDKPDSRAKLTYSATPGAQISDHVAIQNFGTAPLQLHVYANDAFNTSDGGFDIQAAAIAPTDTGAWVHLTGNFITVPARSQVIVPIKIVIPSNASPGDHAGGIVAGLTRITTDAKGNRVNVEERVGTRIYIRIPGALDAALAVTGVRTTYHGSWNPFGTGSATVTYTVRNTGNVRLGAAQHVRVSSLIGGSRESAPLADIKELLPGQQLTLSAQVSGVLPSVMSTGRVTIDPYALPGDIDPKGSSASASAATAAMPWALLILLALLGGLAFRRLRARRGGTPAAPAKPSPKPAPAKVKAG